jgi:mannose-6-phosphate isomerase-like protein (cupin superfamily)
MTNFVNVRDILKSLKIDPSTAADPTRRMFIFDGAHLSANIATGVQAGSALHTQSAHDEIVVVLEGEAEFRVGDETRVVSAGDVVFIPQNTLHGRVRTISPTWAALSIYAPYFDRARKNIQWA